MIQPCGLVDESRERTFSVPCKSRWPGWHQVSRPNSSSLSRFPIVEYNGTVDPSRDDHPFSALAVLISVQHAILLSKLRRHHASARAANERCCVLPKPHPIGCGWWLVPQCSFSRPIQFQFNSNSQPNINSAPA